MSATCLLCGFGRARWTPTDGDMTRIFCPLCREFDVAGPTLAAYKYGAALFPFDRRKLAGDFAEMVPFGAGNRVVTAELMQELLEGQTCTLVLRGDPEGLVATSAYD